jgi:hypothetical protein
MEGQRENGPVTAVLIYLVAIVAANLTVAHFGPWIAPINAFLLIGLDLSIRDRLHDRWSATGRLAPRMLALIAAGSLLTYLVSPAAGQVALASLVAFALAAITDTLIYHALRRRPPLARMNGSNIGGALVDSLVFPTLAFGQLLPAVISLQFLAKVAGGALWAFLLTRRTVKET